MGARVGPRSFGDRVTVWEDDDDDVAERRASEFSVAGPLVQPGVQPGVKSGGCNGLL